MQNANVELLHEAVNRNSAMVLSLPSAGILRHHKTRFLGECNDGFWVEAPADDTSLVQSLIRGGQPVGVSFKHGINRVVFMTSLRRREESYAINAYNSIPALLLHHPDRVSAVQRRSNYRVNIPAEAGVNVRVWRIAEKTYLKDRPMANQEISVRVNDLSAGGVGLMLLGKDGQPPRVTAQDRLRVQVEYNGEQILVEGRLRYPTNMPRSDMVRAGIQFKTLQADLEGRQNLARLTRIIGELQRAEIRHYWLGLDKAG